MSVCSELFEGEYIRFWEVHAVEGEGVATGKVENGLSAYYGAIGIHVIAGTDVRIAELECHAVHKVAHDEVALYAIDGVAGSMAIGFDGLYRAGQCVARGKEVDAAGISSQYPLPVVRTFFPCIVLLGCHIDGCVGEDSTIATDQSADVVTMKMGQEDIVDVGRLYAQRVEGRQQARVVDAVARVEEQFTILILNEYGTDRRRHARLQSQCRHKAVGGSREEVARHEAWLSVVGNRRYCYCHFCLRF